MGSSYIYMLLCDDLIYIGSSCDVNRFKNHLLSYKKTLKGNNKHYCSSFKLFDYSKSNDIPIEFLYIEEINDDKDIYVRESYYIHSVNCVNVIDPLTNKKIIRKSIDNIVNETINLINHAKHFTNAINEEKEKQKQLKKEQKLKEKEQKKEEKQLIKEHKKKQTKEKSRLKAKEKVKCEFCNKLISKSNMAIHKKIKHLKALQL
jgi:hypothetical protein